MLDSLPYRVVVAVDFEFTAPPGERPTPICMVAVELRSGQRWRLWHGEFGPVPPYPNGCDVLVVAYYASAELGCYRVLGWPQPPHLLVEKNGMRALAARGAPWSLE